MVIALWMERDGEGETEGKRENPFRKIISLIFLPFSSFLLIHQWEPLIEGKIAKSLLDVQAKLAKIDKEDVKIDTFIFSSSRAMAAEKVVTHARGKLLLKCDDVVFSVSILCTCKL
jgi:hypothetical protein